MIGESAVTGVFAELMNDTVDIVSGNIATWIRLRVRARLHHVTKPSDIQHMTV